MTPAGNLDCPTRLDLVTFFSHLNSPLERSGAGERALAGVVLAVRESLRNFQASWLWRSMPTSWR
jgi:hypothetical protein